MRKLLLVTCLIFWFFSANAQQNFAQYVNPFIGTGGHGHTYPGAQVPHGMVQLSPDTRLDGWDGCGGYHFSDSFIYGFSHTHLSGTGVSDYGDILVMPMSGVPSPDNKIYGSAFDHKNEKAGAGYYQVKLNDENILAELTTTERAGMHRYNFLSNPIKNLILDLEHRDEVIESSLNVEDSVTVTGMRRSKAWATNQYVFFVMKFSSAIIQNGIWEKDILSGNNKSSSSKNIKGYFSFGASQAPLLVKVAISGVNIEGARKNLAAEMPTWDFDLYKKNAETKWNTELSKIAVESNDKNKLCVFYTALYHTAIVPVINMDVDSLYRGRDDKIHKALDFTNYSVFSLWDTYRAAHPLYTIIDRKRTLDYIKTFLAQYEQGGRLPVWELSGNETDCMIGYHSVSVIADAYGKGITGFNTSLALEAMKKSSNWNHLGLPAYRRKGMIEIDDEHESVSKQLEYAYDDFCIAQFAAAIGRTDEQINYLKRAQYYKNMLNTTSGFMQPRKNGDWLRSFEPREVNNHFTEANSWQYSFYFPQDITGYVQMRGGIDKLENQLDGLFSAPSQTTGREQSDITGLIGQYAHGNEPSHHIAYLYNYTGSAHKTQKLVHNIMNTMYSNEPDGLIGNEDCGQMSAWYVLSALGFYPVTPGTTNYVLGTPAFTKATIHLENGNHFEVSANNLNDKNFYVQNASLFSNTQKGFDQFANVSILQHGNILAGGNMIFNMGDKPSTFFSKNYPKGGLSNNRDVEFIVLNPVIHGGGMPFHNNKIVTISAEKGATIYYTLDGTSPFLSGRKYTGPLNISGSLMLQAFAKNSAGQQSFITTALYKKLPHNYTVITRTPFEKQYDGGGAEGLVDGLHGETDWRKGYWQGYQNHDVDVIIDLQSIQNIREVNVGFLQDTRAWIIAPKKVIVAVSLDNKKFTTVYESENLLPIEDEKTQIKNLVANFALQKARYVRVEATQYGKLPAWHLGAGGSSHIFLDEIGVK
ncbi:MAG: GH92 family glycosyl hydrolase [Ferruginibacter sp.]